MSKRLQSVNRTLGTAAFYLGFLIETALVIVDKSNFTNPYTTLFFRGTFVLFVLKIVLTKYPPREIAFFAVCAAVGFISWRVSGRSELLRFAAFLMAAAEGIDLRKLLKVWFFATLSGCLALVLLSVTGIYGRLSETADYGHGIETRFSLGMGHPNALHCMAAMLILCGLYLFEDKLRVWIYMALLTGDVLLYQLTKSNSGLLVSVCAIAGSALLHYGRKLRQGRGIYIAGEAVFAAGLCYSVFAAIVNPFEHPLYKRFDSLLTGRASGLWDTVYHDGCLSTWYWFSARENTTFFDMGWVRLIYWYGVIPAVLIIALVFAMFRVIRRRRDYAALVLFTAVCGYTVLEAHLVSEYIGRNFVLIAAAGFLPELLYPGEEAGKKAENPEDPE